MRRLRQAISLVVLVTMVFGLGYFMGQRQQPVNAQNDPELEELFTPFWEAWDALNQRYVDPLDHEQLMIGAIQGMVDSIGDDNMTYMTSEDLDAWTRSLSGDDRFEGIGATVQQDEETGELIIVRPLRDSPAQAAGLVPGDRIVTVNGENITTLTQEEIISMVRGPAGTPVILGIRREGEEELLEITVVRAVIDLPSAEYQILDNNIGYIQLYQFSQDVTFTLSQMLTDMDANNLNGLILDLRGNPGGYLQTTLDVMSMFIEEGPILIEQLPGDEETVFEATGGAVAPNVPLVVLIDEGSASASEIVAGTLRDRGRAVLVGMPTFGKNTVQTINPLSNGGAVRISIARWVTPNGFSPQPDGFKPDVQVELDPESDPNFDNQLQAAIRALKGMQRNQAQLPHQIGVF